MNFSLVISLEPNSFDYIASNLLSRRNWKMFCHSLPLVRAKPKNRCKFTFSSGAKMHEWDDFPSRSYTRKANRTDQHSSKESANATRCVRCEPHANCSAYWFRAALRRATFIDTVALLLHSIRCERKMSGTQCVSANDKQTAVNGKRTDCNARIRVEWTCSDSAISPERKFPRVCSSRESYCGGCPRAAARCFSEAQILINFHTHGEQKLVALQFSMRNYWLPVGRDSFRSKKRDRLSPMKLRLEITAKSWQNHYLSSVQRNFTNCTI